MADAGIGLGEQPEDFSGALSDVGRQYPGLQPYINNTVISRSPPQNDGRQLEFYQPWEEENPTPGKLHVQLFDPKMNGQYLKDSVAADMLHHLGTTDPDGNPVNPDYRGLKGMVEATMTPQQHRANRGAYEMDKKDYGDVGSYADWMDHSRTDAYIRAGIFPQNNPEWQGFMTPEQQKLMQSIKSLLVSPR